ncbi:hypothetical protein M0638_15965 [Roseomonas sp. NAR14]|uniref:Uncharacterized protein n=1 Tax=Roseomonas acroporae TaxID=2937791 RepID=A0A9X2BWB7_9PROT|nr:hypothetical protein [Roseomonas acroporae]MCK8785876.1 hypothetical protein [Roseomonas acroporae]
MGDEMDLWASFLRRTLLSVSLGLPGAASAGGLAAERGVPEKPPALEDGTEAVAPAPERPALGRPEGGPAEGG